VLLDRHDCACCCLPAGTCCTTEAPIAAVTCCTTTAASCCPAGWSWLCSACRSCVGSCCCLSCLDTWRRDCCYWMVHGCAIARKLVGVRRTAALAVRVEQQHLQHKEQDTDRHTITLYWVGMCCQATAAACQLAAVPAQASWLLPLSCCSRPQQDCPPELKHGSGRNVRGKANQQQAGWDESGRQQGLHQLLTHSWPPTVKRSLAMGSPSPIPLMRE
jgi:hypothetical protein